MQLFKGMSRRRRPRPLPSTSWRSIDPLRFILGEGTASEETARAIYTMHSEVLTNTFNAIDRHYGSFDAYVRDALKLTDAEVKTLRVRLLE